MVEKLGLALFCKPKDHVPSFIISTFIFIFVLAAYLICVNFSFIASVLNFLLNHYQHSLMSQLNGVGYMNPVCPFCSF